MAYGNPPAIQQCDREDHPDRRHGHYGGWKSHPCADFNSPLLNEENGGHTERGYILIYEKKSHRINTPSNMREETSDGPQS